MTLPSMRFLRARLVWAPSPPSLTCALRPEADKVRQIEDRLWATHSGCSNIADAATPQPSTGVAQLLEPMDECVLSSMIDWVSNTSRF
jgi:hypothetical protein